MRAQPPNPVIGGAPALAVWPLTEVLDATVRLAIDDLQRGVELENASAYNATVHVKITGGGGLDEVSVGG